MWVITAGNSNMTTYTNISKPSVTSYSNQNTTGKEQYDQVTLTFDEISVFYDGIDATQYTNINKPLS